MARFRAPPRQSTDGMYEWEEKEEREERKERKERKESIEELLGEPEEMKLVQIRIPASERDRFKMIAASENLTMGRLLLRMIQEYED